jgi:integrase
MSHKSPRVPGYRRHSSGQARVTLDNKDHLLGAYGSDESREAYRRLVAEWLQRKGAFAPAVKEQAQPLSVNELILAYWRFAEDYYGFDSSDDAKRGDGYCLRDALRVVKALYGHTPGRAFGPKALKACRGEMVRKGWSRTYTNAQVDRVRRMFRWAAEEELLPASVWQGLRALAGLRAGKTAARETEAVKPVTPDHVEATLPHMPLTVRAMVQFQLWTGCRPDEVCRIRAIDLDMGNPGCWVYRPGSDRGTHGQHKTAHKGKVRLVLIGPRAQAVLRPYLGTKLDAYCFSPEAGEEQRNARRRAERKSPMTPS